MPSYKIGKRELESLDISSAPSLTRTRSQTRAAAEAAEKEASAPASVPAAPASSGRKRRAEDTEDQRQSKSAKHKATEKEDITYPSGAIDDIDDDDSILEDIGEEVSGAAGEDVATKDAVVEDFAAKDDAAVEEGADMKTDGHSHVVSKAEPAATSSHEARPEPATEPPASLPRHNLTVKQWKRLEKGKSLPYFLYPSHYTLFHSLNIVILSLLDTETKNFSIARENAEVPVQVFQSALGRKPPSEH